MISSQFINQSLNNYSFTYSITLADWPRYFELLELLKLLIYIDESVEKNLNFSRNYKFETTDEWTVSI